MQSQSRALVPVGGTQSKPLDGKVLRDTIIFLTLVVSYIVTSKLGFTLAFTAEQITSVWPPTGISLAAILLLGYRVWPAIALGAFLTNITAHEPLGTALGIACGNTLEAVMGAVMLRRFVHFDNSLSRFRDVLGLVFCSAVLATMISATMGVASLCLGGVQAWGSFPSLWLLWWLGDAVGALTITPLILAWVHYFRSPWSGPMIAEGLALIAGLTVALTFIFEDPIGIGGMGHEFIYIVFPFLIWAALRFGQQGTSLVTLVASGIAIWATIHHSGPFGADSIDQSLMLLQSFMAIVATTGLYLGASRQIEKENKKLLVQATAEAQENARLVMQIREADQRKDEFLATLAHELRNPLAPIQNALNAFRLSKNSQKKPAETLSLIENQMKQLARLVDDLLDISRITRGKMDIRMERIFLADVLRAAVETAKPLMIERGHRLTVQLPDPPVSLMGDDVRLAQVFSNLLNNAAKYTDPGGHIKLKSEWEESQVIVTIQDNGIGISGEMLTRVFELFVQADHSFERAQGGLGIGLTLSRNLIVAHGGSIQVKSEGLGKGSEFIVQLPAQVSVAVQTPQQPKQKEVRAKQKLRPKALPPCRTLIVDDNKDSAQTMGWMMELLGHEIHLAHDGPSAIALAGHLRPDFILLDIGLPDMNGYDVCETLKQNPALQNTIFIAQTGWGQPEHIRRSQAAGFDHHLVKPIKMEDLNGIVASVKHCAAA